MNHLMSKISSTDTPQPYECYYILVVGPFFMVGKRHLTLVNYPYVTFKILSMIKIAIKQI
jgi:hypothetical protein